MTKRSKETLEIFEFYGFKPITISMVGRFKFCNAYTFRNGVSELRREGHNIEYDWKNKAYVYQQPVKFEANGQVLMF